MIAEASIFCILFFVIVSSLKPSFDKYCVFLLAFLLSVISACRDSGFDLENYKLIIDGALQLRGNDFLDVIAVVKDIGFLFSINFGAKLFDISGEFGIFESLNIYFWVLLLMSLLGFISKAIVASLLPRYKTLFIAVYAFFFSTSLEFAAIRSAVGIGFLGLALLYTTNNFKRSTLLLLSINFHASMAFGTACIWRKFVDLSFNKFWFLPLFTTVITAAGLGMIFQFFGGRGFDPGTVYAPFFPIVTLGSFFLFTRQDFVFRSDIELQRFRTSFIAAYFFALLALFLVVPISVAGIRFLEISLFFFLYAFFSVLINNKPKPFTIFAGISILIILAWSNILRMTWDAILNAEFS